jgi:50S ribosomal protein L16 3-hydroxylase
MSPERFLRTCWTRRSVVGRGAHLRIPELFAAPELQTLDAIFACPHRQVQAWFSTENGAHVQVRVSAAEARSLYARGATTIVVDFLDHPEIARLLSHLYAELGTPQHELYCSAYLSPPGIGTRMHFDSQDNFLVQIRGEKRWKLAPVAEIKYPNRSFVPAVGKLEPELAAVVKKFPDKMPRNATTATLKRGSGLYMPKGYWHASETIRESLALTLSFPSMSFMDIALSHLRRRLVAREEWRAPAVGLTTRGVVQLAALSRLDDLLEGLGAELSSLGAVDFITT